MKKFYAVVALSLAVVGVQAQTQNLSAPRKFGKVPTSVPARVHSSSNTTQSSQGIYVDYDFMDEQYQTNNVGAYTRYIWDMNMNYDYNQGDTSLKYAVVDFSSLYDSYVDANTVIPYNTCSSYTIDSVLILAGHENNSTQNDTILCKIVSLSAAGYPQTTNVLNTSQIITNTSLSAGDWLQSTLIHFEPNFTVNSNTQKFGVMIEYHGARVDTFGILSGFGDLGAGNCTNLPTLPNFAVKSNYYANSYRHDMRFALPPYNIQLLPNSAGNDTYYDCDGSGSYNNTSSNTPDSENFLQNWSIWVHMTLNGVGMNEEHNGLKLSQNQPNPFRGTTTINYETKAAGDVTLTVFDVTGKKAMEVKQDQQGAGKHSINLDATKLAAGVYYYTLKAGDASATKKMVIAE